MHDAGADDDSGCVLPEAGRVPAAAGHSGHWQPLDPHVQVGSMAKLSRKIYWFCCWLWWFVCLVS